MKKVCFVFSKILFAYFIAAIGIVMTINSNLGLSPWDVLHQGISKVSKISIGQASIGIGLVVVFASLFLGVKIGIATILNVLMIGYFIDLIIFSNFIPISPNIKFGILMMLAGILLLAFATYLYLSCGMGCGPRDGLMVALTKKSKLQVGMIRGLMEFTVMTIGYFLGGFVGLGTLITAIGVAYFIRMIFKIFKYDVKDTEHLSIKDGLIWIKESIIR